MGVYGLLSFPTSASPLSLSTKRHRSTKNKWVKDGNQMAMGLLLVLRDQAQFPSCIASHLLALVWLGCLFEFPLDFKMNQEVLGCRLELLFTKTGVCHIVWLLSTSNNQSHSIAIRFPSPFHLLALGAPCLCSRLALSNYSFSFSPHSPDCTY